jgi:membrane protein DedA with SNARE-associated domain
MSLSAAASHHVTPAVILALLSIPKNVGYPILFLLVGAEASGVPLPGETALITSSVVASDGSLSIEVVIAIAAVAAIVGDNIGYVIGARYGRRLLTRPGRTQTRRLEALEKGNALMERHGPKAVFFGRWIAGLRIWASWLAGMTTMPWRSFLVWNALGGITWALWFGLLGYFGGEAAARLIARVGVGVAIAVVSGIVVAYVIMQVRRRRRAGEPR